MWSPQGPPLCLAILHSHCLLPIPWSYPRQQTISDIFSGTFIHSRMNFPTSKLEIASSTSRKWQANTSFLRLKLVRWSLSVNSSYLPTSTPRLPLNTAAL
ncbi:hypothetical protein C8R44DRAFT_977671 [Mycena epipterygia]|nr:hypothetical protein C8R44DRAFT_977671 [Mycena epipterygia]